MFAIRMVDIRMFTMSMFAIGNVAILIFDIRMFAMRMVVIGCLR